MDDIDKKEKVIFKKTIKKILHWGRWHIATPICHLFKIVGPTDWVDCYTFMSKAILPYLYSFRKHEKHGYTTTLFSYFKDEIETLGFKEDKEKCSYSGEVQGITFEEWCIKKWDWIINEIIFALEYTVDENWDDCTIPNEKYNPDQKEFFKSEPCEDNKELSRIIFNEDYGKTKLDHDLLGKKEKRIQEGLKMLGYFYQCIWD